MNAQQSPSIRIASTAANDAQSDGARLFGGQHGDRNPLPMIGTGLQAGYAEPSRVHADHLLRDGGDGL